MQCRVKVITKTGKSYSGKIYDYSDHLDRGLKVDLQWAMDNNMAFFLEGELGWWIIPPKEISCAHLAVWDPKTSPEEPHG